MILHFLGHADNHSYLHITKLIPIVSIRVAEEINPEDWYVNREEFPNADWCE
jgi:hypothetical protein